jgi:hypothetical protein
MELFSCDEQAAERETEDPLATKYLSTKSFRSRQAQNKAFNQRQKNGRDKLRVLGFLDFPLRPSRRSLQRPVFLRLPNLLLKPNSPRFEALTIIFPFNPTLQGYQGVRRTKPTSGTTPMSCHPHLCLIFASGSSAFLIGIAEHESKSGLFHEISRECSTSASPWLVSFF